MMVATTHFNKYNLGVEDFVTPGMQLKYVAEAHPDDVAIAFIKRDFSVETTTWRKLHIDSNKMAWRLKEAGVSSGSRVLVALPNGIKHIIATLAIWKVGGCYVPTSEKSPDDEFLEIWRQVGPKVVFSDSCIPNCTVHISSESFDETMSGYPEEMPPDVISNPNMISLSGGTSGQIKLLQQNMPCGMTDVALKSWFDISGQDFGLRIFVTGPLFHGAPHSAAFNAIYSGNTLFFSESLRPENIVKCIKKFHLEHVQMVPTLMYRILKVGGLSRSDFASVKVLYHTGGYCSPFLKQSWIDLMSPEKIYEVYSMTEAIGMTCIRGDEWVKHRGSVGRCVSGSISIRDPEFNEVPPFKTGEIFFKAEPGAELDVKYLNREQLEVKSGGYKSVGDLGYIDDEGYLFFVDRRSDMIVTGGENVFASEIENVLIMNKDVVDAVVIGIPDEEWGRRVHAIVEVKRTISEEELKNFMKKYLAPCKIPRSFEFVSSIPRKDSGKINRSELLKKYA